MNTVLKRKPIKIVTEYDRKPISSHHWDWEAVTDEYDGAEDSSTRHQIGYGASEAEAIADLKDQLGEE